MFPACSPHVPRMFPSCSNISAMFPPCSLMFPSWFLNPVTVFGLTINIFINDDKRRAADRSVHNPIWREGHPGNRLTLKRILGEPNIIETQRWPEPARHQTDRGRNKNAAVSDPNKPFLYLFDFWDCLDLVWYFWISGDVFWDILENIIDNHNASTSTIVGRCALCLYSDTRVYETTPPWSRRLLGSPTKEIHPYIYIYIYVYFMYP